MERPRFSNKYLLRSAKTEFIVPEGYKELHNAQLLHETEKAMYIEFVYLTKTYYIWFPKNFVVKNNSKFYAAEWILKRQLV